jgi:hypothetical protein
MSSTVRLQKQNYRCNQKSNSSTGNTFNISSSSFVPFRSMTIQELVSHLFFQLSVLYVVLCCAIVECRGTTSQHVQMSRIVNVPQLPCHTNWKQTPTFWIILPTTDKRHHLPDENWIGWRLIVVWCGVTCRQGRCTVDYWVESRWTQLHPCYKRTHQTSLWHFTGANTVGIDLSNKYWAMSKSIERISMTKKATSPENCMRVLSIYESQTQIFQIIQLTCVGL